MVEQASLIILVPLTDLHIPIETPRVADEHTFVNRKKKHSINIQAICDHNLLIRHLVARWPEVPTTI